MMNFSCGVSFLAAAGTAASAAFCMDWPSLLLLGGPKGKAVVEQAAWSRLGSNTRQRAIDLEIVARHALDAEALVEAGADHGTIEFGKAGHGLDRLVDIANDEAAQSRLDHFRHRCCVKGDHRGAARHGLDHHQSERFGPVYGKQERTRIAEKGALLLLVDLADIFHVGVTF